MHSSKRFALIMDSWWKAFLLVFSPRNSVTLADVHSVEKNNVSPIRFILHIILSVYI